MYLKQHLPSSYKHEGKSSVLSVEINYFPITINKVELEAEVFRVNYFHLFCIDLKRTAVITTTRIINK